MRRGRLCPMFLIAVLASAFAAAPSHADAAGSNQSPKLDAAQLAGTWRVSLHEADGVEIAFRMTFVVNAAEPLRWEAYSRQGAARELVGGGTALLGRVLGKMPPHEALVYIGNGTAEKVGDSVALKGALESPFLGRRDFAGVLTTEGIRSELTRTPSGAKAGTVDAVRDASEAALRDYQSLGAELERAVRGGIYDPAIFEQRAASHFFDELRSRFTRARDDLDVIVSFQALKPSVKTSHFELIRDPRLAARSLEEVIAGDAKVNPDGYVRVAFHAPEVAFLTVKKWDRVAPAIDRAFERLVKVGARVLVIDIRGNPGGDATSMAPLAHLIREPVTLGAFVGRKWYEAHRAAPTPPDFEAMRAVSADAPASQLFEDLRRHGAVVARVTPRAPYFGGAVYLLTDRTTASASEPLAHFLKATRRAAVIGERTAGAMLVGLPHGLRDGWVVTVPEADYVAWDGLRLESRGVEPDVKTEADGVLLAVAERLEATMPYSAAVLRGGAYEVLKRPADAERAYRASLRLAEQLHTAADTVWRIAVHKRLAFIMSARGDREGALGEYREVLKLAPDDAEALAATRGHD